jgi:hypothetical protein
MKFLYAVQKAAIWGSLSALVLSVALCTVGGVIVLFG